MPIPDLEECKNCGCTLMEGDCFDSSLCEKCFLEEYEARDEPLFP